MGSFNATKKASAIGPAPKKAAVKISLKNPAIRLNSVRLLTVKKADKKLIFFEDVLDKLYTPQTKKKNVSMKIFKPTTPHVKNVLKGRYQFIETIFEK